MDPSKWKNREKEIRERPPMSATELTRDVGAYYDDMIADLLAALDKARTEKCPDCENCTHRGHITKCTVVQRLKKEIRVKDEEISTLVKSLGKQLADQLIKIVFDKDPPEEAPPAGKPDGGSGNAPQTEAKADSPMTSGPENL